MAKRILIYTNHFYPEQFKINEIVDWLSNESYYIRVITCNPKYPKGSFYKGYGFFSIFNNNYKKNVIVNRMPLIPRGNGNYFLRFLNYLTYFISTFFFTIYLILFKKKYDYIFVHHTSPFLITIHPIIYGFFYKSTKILWDLDLWPDTLKALNIIRSKFVFNSIEFFVKFVYSFYDKLLIGSKGFEELVEKRFDGEIIYFPNWSESVLEENNTIKSLNINIPNDHFTIMYTGNIGHAQGLDVLIDVIKQTNDKNIFWIFIGEGSYKKTLVKNLDNFSLLNKCKFINQIDINEIPSYAKIADAMFFSLKDNYLFSKTVPAKMQSYMALGKPIIAIIKGEGAKAIKDSNSGIVISSSDTKKITSIIIDFSKRSISELNKMGNNGRMFYKNNFSIKLRKKQLLNFFK